MLCWKNTKSFFVNSSFKQSKQSTSFARRGFVLKKICVDRSHFDKLLITSHTHSHSHHTNTHQTHAFIPHTHSSHTHSHTTHTIIAHTLTPNTRTHVYTRTRNSVPVLIPFFCALGECLKFSEPLLPALWTKSSPSALNSSLFQISSLRPAAFDSRFSELYHISVVFSGICAVVSVFIARVSKVRPRSLLLWW